LCYRILGFTWWCVYRLPHGRSRANTYECRTSNWWNLHQPALRLCSLQFQVKIEDDYIQITVVFPPRLFFVIRHRFENRKTKIGHCKKRWYPPGLCTENRPIEERNILQYNWASPVVSEIEPIPMLWEVEGIESFASDVISSSRSQDHSGLLSSLTRWGPKLYYYFSAQ